MSNFDVQVIANIAATGSLQNRADTPSVNSLIENFVKEYSNAHPAEAKDSWAMTVLVDQVNQQLVSQGSGIFTIELVDPIQNNCQTKEGYEYQYSGRIELMDWRLAKDKNNVDRIYYGFTLE